LESPRTFELTGNELSVIVDNILGGREYEIQATVTNETGQKTIARIKTPYIREFENLGKLLYEKGKIISAVYMLWNMKDVPMPPDDEPLLGRYDALDDIVQWKHIDWATGHGINVFWIDAWNPSNTLIARIMRKILDKKMIAGGMWGPSEYYIRGTLAELPEWAIDLQNPHNENYFLKTMEFLASFVIHSNFFRMNGKPTIFLYDAMALFREGEAFEKAKQIFEDVTGNEAYFISDTLPRIPDKPDDSHIEIWFSYKNLTATDALTSWVGFMSNTLEHQEYAENYDKYYEPHLTIWYDFTKSLVRQFIPTIIPGFDNSYSWGSPNQIPIERDPTLFFERLLSTLKYSDPHVRIDTWNDFGEWTYIEPSIKDNDIYLKMLRKFVLEYILK
jgi:hypothetical protein